MNTQKLKGIIRERDKNYNQCANAIGKSVAAFNSKINGRVAFTVIECEDLGNFLGMTDNEKIEVFLRQNYHNVIVYITSRKEGE